MFTSFQCPHCPRNFSTWNAYFQHVNRCINTVYLSTEESSEDISDIVSSVNEMSLDDEDFSNSNVTENAICIFERIKNIAYNNNRAKAKDRRQRHIIVIEQRQKTGGKDFQCPHCPRNFSTWNAYFQHVNRCINTVYLSTEESSEDISDIVSSVNEMSLDDEDFSRINEFQIIREENSQVFYQYESDQDYAGDISFGEISHLSNIPEEYENFDEILPASLKAMKNPNEEPEVENIKEFPNETYADLMALVIENNLNNKAGNAIIKFFNKHSDLSQLSPLPKNIKTG
ncbi:hypothetical protein Glove_380g9 [Diversispora epigaea]|uniref:C2H2-type domain-containing protein n=1 Tax=Diversispora epigaea TaxID=1348612 RepID=A0A397H4N3_9GLOM|nr:hypothetical protein Glove_380g9 [Diversispora epigaea]